jgi:hypothetical protein
LNTLATFEVSSGATLKIRRKARISSGVTQRDDGDGETDLLGRVAAGHFGRAAAAMGIVDMPGDPAKQRA